MPLNLKEEMDSTTMTPSDFTTLLSSMARLSKQKISEDTSALKIQMDLTDNYITLHPAARECACFFLEDGIFSRIDHMIGL